MEKDILIIGGGPAGLSTAFHLQQIAPELISRILILEKAHYPRPKLCAGGLVADAEVLLEGLGLDVTKIPHVDGTAAHFDFAGKGMKVSVPGAHTLRIIRRDEFDAWLAGKARERGITIREGITVKSLKPDFEGVTVETDSGTYRAKIVIGADGSNGMVRRAVLPQASIYTARVLEAIAPAKDANLHKAQESYFDFFPVPAGIAGYTWDFPTQIKGQPMRCWGIYDANILADAGRPPLKELLSAEMARFGFDLGDYELKGHPIRWFDPTSQMSVPRVLLVGDAVGADSIFGEGISVALGYGKVAAREVAQAFRQDNFDFTGYRRRVLWSPLGQTLIARWIITHIIYPLRWKWFQILLWRWLKPIVILVAWIFVLNWAKRMGRT
ncbi:MAG: NAD(P)/FAD-dependent oxidoreductase [Chloroflexi bacterium]|nr:NAD(P)/FAD-dependent oxidoreductase [Chloroflexota bacterium]